jgi:signal transduction histidine kinase
MTLTPLPSPTDLPTATPTAPPDLDRTAALGTISAVARALAAGTDSAEVLKTLCDAATIRGRGTGAAVAEVSVDTGTYVAVTDNRGTLAGLRFSLNGTITGRAANERRPIAVLSAGESSPFFAELMPRLGIGPILVLPLLAHNVLLGVLSVFRDVGQQQFDAQDEERLATVADLAALALWKARKLEEVESANAAKTSLLATLSHELRTPFTALEGYGELLEDEILGPLSPAQRDVILRLRSVGRHLGALIEDLLTYASLEADHLTPRDGPVRLEELIDSLLVFVEPLAREKGIELSVDVEEGLPEIRTDEARARQILLNLCQNAVKFTEHGEVAIKVSRGSPGHDGVPTVRLAVRDSGIGIEASDLQRLFRPFSQLEDVPTRRHRGTGLGLYISKRLAMMLGGRVEVVSRPGEGSVFTLVLPASH